MALIPLIDCYDLLDLDPKTVRASLKRAGIVVTAHPTDARIKCVTTEQIERLASMHARVLRPLTADAGMHLEGASAYGKSGERTSHDPASTQDHLQTLPLKQPDASLLEKVASLETRVTQLSDQVAELALLVLRERDRTLDQRIGTLETALAELARPSASLLQRPDPGTPLERSGQAGKPHQVRELRPAEQLARSRMPPLIEYSAPGTYVIVSSLEGELHLAPDSAEWFDWLASLSSFRFVGQAGRFTACREDKQSRGWVAHRSIHRRCYKRYLGVTERLTIASLEKMAAQVQAQMRPS